MSVDPPEDQARRPRPNWPMWAVLVAIVGVIVAVIGISQSGGFGGGATAGDTTGTTTEVGPPPSQPAPAPTPQTVPSEACNPNTAAPTTGTEPNNTIEQAYGPLLAGQVIHDRISTSNDEDYYVFCTTGGADLTVSLRLLDCPEHVDQYTDCANLFAELRDAQNQQVPDGETDLYSLRDKMPPITYTASAAARYYLYIHGDQGNQYSLQVTTVPGDMLGDTLQP